MVIFTTVFMDLVGFGMIIPLVNMYGKDLGASGWVLALLGSSYSIAQFFFAPLWGRLSDRYGRRPIILMSLAGSSLAFFGFAGATAMNSLGLLLLTRFFQGAFAANISAAQAYIADVTPPEQRTGGMALIGAAFGIGFVFGPVIGGASMYYLGALAPGIIAGSICGANLLLAWRRLPESLSPEIRAHNRAEAPRPYDPLNLAQLKEAWSHPYLGLLLSMSFLQLVSFGMMEQVFALFFKAHLGLSSKAAALKTGYALAYVGLVAGAIQGGLTRRLAPRFGDRRLLLTGLTLFSATLFFLPFGPSYASYFVLLLPLSIGRSLIDPSTSSLISKSVGANEQGRTFGTFQGLSSLARIVGPFVGLTLFESHLNLPFQVGGALCVVVLGMGLFLLKPGQKAPMEPLA
jgi:DHA1 family tetracycline resistance protein-like MFS transporter